MRSGAREMTAFVPHYCCGADAAKMSLNQFLKDLTFERSFSGYDYMVDVTLCQHKMWWSESSFKICIDTRRLGGDLSSFPVRKVVRSHERKRKGNRNSNLAIVRAQPRRSDMLVEGGTQKRKQAQEKRHRMLLLRSSRNVMIRRSTNISLLRSCIGF